jgi:5,10-methylene-tetrahydrofolate dehydrogenase/methenyl tetrahydrofolate cyclohydrolase
MDEDGSVGNAYNVIGVPMMMLLDKSGNIVKVGHSSKDMPLDKVLR